MDKRDLLKILAATPAVWTLRSGASVANTSSCIDKPDSYNSEGGLTASCLTSLGVDSQGSTLING